MPHEFAFAGILIPGLLPIFLFCLALSWLLDRLAGRHGWYRHVWHPALFRLALLGALFGVFGLWLLH